MESAWACLMRRNNAYMSMTREVDDVYSIMLILVAMSQNHTRDTRSMMIEIHSVVSMGRT